jgi:putative membrane protein
MPRLLLLAALPLALLTTTGVRAQSASPKTSQFIAKASATDAFERNAGQLAEKKSTNPDVREFGAMMSRVHAETTAKLLAVLDKDHLPKPGKTPNPDPNQAKQLTDLVDAPKGQFDRAYAHSQVVAHQQALALMQEYAATGDNPELKQLAADTEAVVQRHLDMAQKLEAQLGGPPKSLGRKED